MPVKKPLPSRCGKPDSSLQLTAEGTNSQATAMKVSGIIDSTASTAAKPAPKRMPRSVGTRKARMPTTEMASVHQAIGVWIGVKPDVVSSPKRSAR